MTQRVHPAGFCLAMAVLLTVAARGGVPTVTLTNSDGQVLQLTGAVERLVVAGRAPYALVHALALFPETRDKLLAASGARQWGAEAQEFLVRAQRLPANLARLGGEVGPEQLAPLRPDLVLVKSATARVRQGLAEIGIPTWSLELESPEEYEREMLALGRLLGNAARGEALAAYYRECRKRVTARLADLPREKRPRVLLVQAFARGGVLACSVPPVDWMQTRLVELAGGEPVWREAAKGGGWMVVGLEQVAVWNPEVVLVADYSDGPVEMAARLRAHPLWQTLAAFQQGRVWTFPRDFTSWDQPDPRWGLGLLWTAQRLHPARFAEVDLWQEVVAFYRWYGLAEREVITQIKPRLRGDWP